MARYPSPTALFAAGALLAASSALADPSPSLAADWDGTPQAEAWTRAAEPAVAGLAAMTPTDAQKFCANYDGLNPAQRQAFWVEFVSALARSESELKPTLSRWSMLDADVGRPTFRRGLLQISIESADRPDYGCGLNSPEALLTAEGNLACGGKILQALITHDGVIAETSDAGAAEGAARYWPSLAKSASRAVIAGKTEAMPFCAPSPAP